MKVAIHHREGSFSDRWITYCKEKGIDYKLVNAYDSDIVKQVADCDVFMWHFHHSDYRDMQMAKALLISLQTRGMKVFPDVYTCWHFDNKVWEKYLLESIDAPIVPSYVFYSEKEAIEWSKRTTFPKVFKLKGGAGASNVLLAHSKKECQKLIHQAFGGGFLQYRWRSKMKEAWRQYKLGKASLRDVLRPFKYGLQHYPTTFDHFHGPEIGYVYFQDFIPHNSFDIRVIVVGDKAFAIRRLVRKNDFRASGSGDMHYERAGIPEECVKDSFDIAAKLHSQSVSFDFLLKDDKPLVVEISYGFTVEAYDSCPGYWTKDMKWHEGQFNPQVWMIENLIMEGEYNKSDTDNSLKLDKNLV